MKNFTVILCMILFLGFVLLDAKELNAIPRKKYKKSYKTYRSYKPLPVQAETIASVTDNATVNNPQPILPQQQAALPAAPVLPAAPDNNVAVTATPANVAAPAPTQTAAQVVAPPSNQSLQPMPKQTLPFLVGDFESGSYTKNPEFWKFDRLNLSVVENDPAEINENKLGKYSLLIEGSTLNWYIGGFGTYIGKEIFSKYDTLEMMVYGNGSSNGQLKIELVDDDNKNGEVDTDPTKGWDPTKDDKYSYNLEIDWTGWKLVQIPFSDFLDANPGIGDDKLDHKLLTIQFIALSSGKAIGKIDAKIDYIRFVKIY